MPIPSWNWERITMDFVVGLPTTVGAYDSIWVVVDRLTKSSHFIHVQVKYRATKLAELHNIQIVRLYGVLVCIVSNRERWLVRMDDLGFGGHALSFYD
ncbi:hypothetical protein MTR67_034746 [Solanum verrucosum]|uniref:Uncharacterized protein n=1 Tax=Solanum verrucosum TaxID=315347 RepID=A0AAF0U904_SOLVR|nr:hypothetical protein MTR67_034746 [Solanum verrucosum]